MGMLFLGVAALALPAFGSGGQPADGSRESFGWMPFAAAGALGGWMALGVLCGLAYSLLDRASDAGWLLYAGGVGWSAAVGVGAYCALCRRARGHALVGAAAFALVFGALLPVLAA